MTWFHLSLLSIFAVALADLTQQHLLNKQSFFSERTTGVVTFLIQSIITLPFLLLLQPADDILYIFDKSIFPRLFLVSAIAAVGVLFYFKSFLVKNISISGIMVSLSVVVSTTLGIIFFQESMSLIKIIGILLILAAIVSLNIKNAKLERNHLYGLLAGLFFGVSYTIDKSILQEIDPLVYIFWTFLLTGFFGFALSPREVLKDVKNAGLVGFKPIFVAGVGYWTYNFATFNAYTLGGEVGKIDAINNSSVFLIILFEYFVLKEKDSHWRKIITAFIAFTGIYILGNYQ